MTVTADSGPDTGVPWHYGHPMHEQRDLDAGSGMVDLSHRGVITVSGPDRLSWLHSLTTQHLEQLQPHVGTTALVLSPQQGHIDHVLYGVDDGEAFWAHTEPGRAPALAEWLDSMRFMLRVEVADRTSDFAVVWVPDRPGIDPQDAPSPAVPDTASSMLLRVGRDSLDGAEIFVPRDRLDDVLGSAESLAGTWAYEARRIAAGVPRIGQDTDHRAIPNEIGVFGTAVHLNKGCYPGQETVARVQTLGRPPRRLVRLQLDGSVDALPAVGAPISLRDRQVGVMGSSARHYEQGPIGLALVKRNTDANAELIVDGIAAAQEVLVDPEIGEHFRPSFRR
jgi:folate-binding protein YgfZ